METNRINYITIQQYLDGSLDKEAMHELEKQALDDPFLADALEGYSHINKPAGKQLSLLQQQLQERIAQQQEDKNVFNFSWQRLSVAAAAGLLFVTASILFWIKGEKRDEQLASNPKQVEATLTPKDSIKSDDSVQAETDVTQVQPFSEDGALKKRENAQIADLKKESSHTRVNAKASNTPHTLNEVVISGYGTQSRETLTQSVSQVDAVALQGKVAGLSSSKNIFGKVLSKDGQPLPGVSVRLKSTRKSTVTDVNGEFALNDSLGGDINLSFIGFTPKEVKAKPGVPLVVALNEDSSALSEVIVVSGYSRNILKEESQPSIGWVDYNEYLSQSAKVSKGKVTPGKVKVSFTIGQNNQLGNFKILRGVNEITNLEAIRLIKKGPGWQRGQDTTASVTVRFKK